MIRFRLGLNVLLLCMLILMGRGTFAQDCPPSRLSVGSQARVVDSANRLRDAPSTGANRIGEIPPNVGFNVLAIGDCEGGYRWVEVDFGGQVGWTAEGDASAYFLEPLSASTAATSETPSDLPLLVRRITAPEEGGTWGKIQILPDGGLVSSRGVFSSDLNAPPLSLPPQTDVRQDYLASPTQPNLVFVYSLDSSFRLWDTASNQVIWERTLTPPNPNSIGGGIYFQKAGFSGDGSLLVYTSTEGTQALDMTTLQPVTLSEPIADRFALSQSARWIAHYPVKWFQPEDLSETAVLLLDRDTNTQTTLTRDSLEQVMSLAFTPDDTQLVSVDLSGALDVWRVGEWSRRRSERGADIIANGQLAASNTHAAYVGDASIGERVLVIVRDLATLEEVGTLILEGSSGAEVAFTPDGSQLVVSAARELFFVDVAALPNASPLTLIERAAPTVDTSALQTLDFTCGQPTQLGNNTIVRTQDTLRMRAFPSTNGEFIESIAPDTELEVDGIQADPVVCNEGYTWVHVRLASDRNRMGWVAESDATTQNLSVVSSGFAGANANTFANVTTLFWSHDGGRIFVSDLRRTYMLDLNAPNLLYVVPALGKFAHPVTGAPVWVAGIDNAETLIEWNSDTGERRTMLEFQEIRSGGAVMHAMADAFVVFDYDTFYRIERSILSVSQRTKLLSTYANFVRFSPSGRWLGVVGQNAGDVLLVDVNRAAPVPLTSDTNAAIERFAFDASDNYVFVTHRNNITEIRSLPNLTLVQTVPNAQPIGVSADGSLFLNGRNGALVELATLTERWQISGIGSITHAAFNADSSRLAVIAGGKLYLYDVVSGRQLAMFNGYQGR